MPHIRYYFTQGSSFRQRRIFIFGALGSGPSPGFSSRGQKTDGGVKIQKGGAHF